MAQYLGLDPDLATAAAADMQVDMVGILRGIQGYRHLDRFKQYEVNKELAKLQRDYPNLYGSIQLQQAGSIGSPYQSPWSLSDEEIDKAMRENETVLEHLDVLGDAQDAVSIAALFSRVLRSLPKAGPAAAALTAMLLGLKWMTKGGQEMLPRERAARQRSDYPFRPDMNP